MDSPSSIFVAVGILVVVSRGPLILAPSATLRCYRRLLFSTNERFRAVGVMFALLAMLLIFFDFGEGGLAGLLHIFGWFLATVALQFLVLPNVFRRFFQTILGYIEESVHDGVVRIVGLLAVVFGVALIYVGVYVV